MIWTLCHSKNQSLTDPTMSANRNPGLETEPQRASQPLQQDCFHQISFNANGYWMGTLCPSVSICFLSNLQGVAPDRRKPLSLLCESLKVETATFKKWASSKEGEILRFYCHNVKYLIYLRDQNLRKFKSVNCWDNVFAACPLGPSAPRAQIGPS